MQTQCILCYEDENIFGVGICNHGPICYKCIIKCRNKMDNKQCPICKENLEKVILSMGFQNYQSLEAQRLYEYENGILYTEQSIKKDLDHLNSFVCWVNNCKEQSFNTIGFLKRHLKDKHGRYLCEICVEFKTALLKEQKLYSNIQLEKHLKNGDYDDDRNLIYFHPYCSFCAKHFYNEEQFGRHMHRDHYGCHICADQEKFRFYKDYKTLETHFKMTHYLCLDDDCLKKGFVVFKYVAEKELHDAKNHGNSYEIKQGKNSKNISKFNLHQMSGFHYEQNDFRNNNNKQDEKIQIKDNEGVDFEYQFMSQRKVHMKDNKNLEQQSDKPIDIRDFYKYIYDQDDETQEDYFKYVWNSSGQNHKYEKRQDNQKKKEKYQKQQYRKEEQQIEKPIIQENLDSQIYIDDLKLIKYNQLISMDIDKFDIKLQKIISKEQFEDFASIRTQYFKSQITAQMFFQQFVKIIGQNLAFKTFPFFITAIPNNETSNELDIAYYNELIKLPRKNDNLILKSQTYLGLLKNILNQIYENIKQRVIDNKIDVNFQKYDKTRLLQLFEILKRVETHEFGKLKYCTNFGVQIDLIQLMKNRIYFMDQNEIQKCLSEQQTDNFIQILTGQKPLDNPNSFHKNILIPFLDQNLDIKNKYFKKKERDSSSSDNDNKVNNINITIFGKNKNYTKQQQQIENKKQENSIETKPSNLKQQQQEQPIKQEVKIPDEVKKPVEVKKPAKVISTDKFEFPVLENEIASNNENQILQQKPEKKEQNDWIQKKNQNPFIDYNKGTKTSQKEINQQFPDLGIMGQQKIDNKIIKQNIINQKNDDSDEQPVQTKKGKQKKGKQVVLGFY